MSSLTINTNIASLAVQRRLQGSQAELQTSFTRLSSGLRINKASDDAAGLSISSLLDTDTRTYSQGLRNVNDAISLLSIAEGAVSQLSGVVIRIRELATQSANGTLAITQRKALHDEANALVSEYNRITSVTNFNGLNLIDSSLQNLNIQAGYGQNGQLALTLGTQLARMIYSANGVTGSTLTTGTAPSSVTSGDVNGDGNLDLVSTDYIGATLSVFLGNSDGTFNARSVFTGGAGATGLKLADFNGDGKLDILNTSVTDGKLGISIGNGNGTFNLRQAYDSIASFVADAADLNGDGILDVVAPLLGQDCIQIMLGNADGTLRARAIMASGDQPTTVKIQDLNGDGFLDILTVVSGADDKIDVFLGNGNGTFRGAISFADGDGGGRLDVGDFNRDGKYDLAVATSDGKANVFLGNGDGTFLARTSLDAGSATNSVFVVDANGDGYLDLVATASGDNSISAILGNGDGTFKARSSTVIAGAALQNVVSADFNKDGVPDIAVTAAAQNSIGVFINGHQYSDTLPYLNLMNRQEALNATPTIVAALNRVTSELGNIGSNQSRLETAAAVLRETTINYRSASSRIKDTDVAQESAALVRNQILEQSGASILAQANQQPGLALTLLRNI